MPRVVTLLSSSLKSNSTDAHNTDGAAADGIKTKSCSSSSMAVHGRSMILNWGLVAHKERRRIFDASSRAATVTFPPGAASASASDAMALDPRIRLAVPSVEDGGGDGEGGFCAGPNAGRSFTVVFGCEADRDGFLASSSSSPSALSPGVTAARDDPSGMMVRGTHKWKKQTSAPALIFCLIDCSFFLIYDTNPYSYYSRPCSLR